jgi:hypothetical protein
MKVFPPLVLALLIASFLQAQVTSQGNFMIGVGLGFSTSRSEVKVESGGTLVNGVSSEALQLNVAPNIGYLVTDNWVIGIVIDYTLSRIKDPIDFLDPETEFNTSYDSNLLFGPFTRYYWPITEHKAFFLESAFGFGSSRNQIQVNNSDQIISNNVMAFSFGPGFTIISTDAIGIEALAKYNWSRSRSDIDFQGFTNTTTTKTNGLDFSVGFQFYFTRVTSATVKPGSGNRPSPFY